MKIESINVAMQGGQSYLLPIEAGTLSALIKDALLKHLLYKADSERAGSEPMNLTVDINSEYLEPKQWNGKDFGAFDGCNIEGLMKLDYVKKHHLTNVPLARGSSRYQLHEAVINYFYGTGNKWISKRALSANLTHVKKVGLARNTIQTYLGEMVGYGLLQDVTEADSTKSLRLSPKLITQAKLNGVAK